MGALETTGPGSGGPRATRRSVLTGTTAGLAALAGAAAADLLSPATAAAAATGTDWIVLTPIANDPTGSMNAANINGTLKSCVPGQVVYLSQGVYPTNVPILVPEGVGLRGPIGATQSGDASNQAWAAVLRPAKGWQPTNTQVTGSPTLPVSGVITLIDIPSNGTAGTARSRMEVRDLWIDGSMAQSTVQFDGIASYGAMNAVALSRVGIDQVSGRGVGLYLDASGNFPDGWLLDTILVQAAGSDGISGHFVDTTLINCHSQLCKGNGVQILGGNNRLTACRADLAGAYGFVVEAYAGLSGYHDANTLIGCGTQRNTKSGLYVPNMSSTAQAPRDPVIAVGCSFDGDGTGNGTGPGNAGMEVSGETRLIAVDCNVLVGTKDVPQPGCPRYAIATYANASGVPDLVQVSGSFLNGVTELVHDTAPSFSMRVDPTNSGYIGGPITSTATPALPVELPAYLGAIQDNFVNQDGTVAATIPRALAATAQGALAPRTLYVTAIGMEAGLKVSRCTMFVDGTAASGLAHGWYVLLDRNLRVLAVTADQTSGTWTAAVTGYTLAFRSPCLTTYSGVYYVGVMVDAATTPTFTGGPALAGGVAGLAGLSPATPIYCGLCGTGLTTPPAVGAPMGPIASDGRNVFYATLS